MSIYPIVFWMAITSIRFSFYQYPDVISKLYQAGFRGAFSVELFNKGYWDSMDAKTILKHSYEKTAQVVGHALAPHI